MQIPHFQEFQVRPSEIASREAHQVEDGQGQGGQVVLLFVRCGDCAQHW